MSSSIAWLIMLPNGAWLGLPAGLWLAGRGIYEHWKRVEGHPEYPPWVSPLARGIMTILGLVTVVISLIIFGYGAAAGSDIVYSQPIPVLPQWIFWVSVTDLAVLAGAVVLAGVLRDSRLFQGVVCLVAASALVVTAGLLAFYDNVWGFSLWAVWLLVGVAVSVGIPWLWWKDRRTTTGP